MSQYIHEITEYFIDIAEHLGYFGIFIAMAIESTFLPLPSEIIMIPAGMAASEGKMSIPILIIIGTAGSLAGAYINYFLAFYLGRSFFDRYGKYLLITQKTMKKIENFFQSYGAVSVFIGRLVPGLRHYISLPAGLARMSSIVFTTYTVLGSAIWCTTLVMIGYMAQNNKKLVAQYLGMAVSVAIIICIILFVISVIRRQRKKKHAKIQGDN